MSLIQQQIMQPLLLYPCIPSRHATHHLYKGCEVPPHGPALLLILFFFSFFLLSRTLANGGGLCLAASKSVTSTSKIQAVHLLQNLWTPFLSLPSFSYAISSLSSPCLSSLSAYYCLSSSSFSISVVSPPVTVC